MVDSEGGAEITYYALLVDEDDSVATPRRVFRRVHDATLAMDELLGRDGEWRPTDILGRVERGEHPGALERLSVLAANVTVDSVRKRYRKVMAALERQARGGFALRLAEPINGRVLDLDERDDVVAFLTNAPAVPDTDGLRTDGFFVWPESVTRLAEQGFAPEPELDYHIGDRRYFIPTAVDPEVLARAARLAATMPRPDGGTGQVREVAPPGQKPRPTQAERLRALSDWHREWQLKHAASTPARPDGGARDGDSDYGLHHVDVEASPDAEWEFTRRAREIMGLDPETGSWIHE